MPSDTGQQQIGGESGSGEHAGDASAVTSPDIAEISARAKENLKQYVIRGIINDEFVPAFFSSIQKVPANIGLGAAAVTMTENGIKLIYDIHHFAKFSKEEIDFVLSHELMHVLSYHFLRGEELMAEIGVGKSEFYGRYAPLADLPVNHSLKSLSGFQDLKEHMLTYERSGLTPDKHPTYEALVRWMRANPDKAEGVLSKLGLDQVEIVLGDPEDNPNGGIPGTGQGPTIIAVDENGRVSVVNPGNGKQVVVIPQVTREGKRECEKNVVEIVKSSNRMAGNAPYEMRRAIEQFLDEYSSQALKGWALLEHLLVGERAINKGQERTYARLNRRTRRLPGKKKIRGFSAMFIVDESGSMSDEEIQLAFSLVKKVVLRENNDKVYVVHWDTEPQGEITELQYESDLDELERVRCGGTDFKEFFRHEIFHQNDYDLYVCVTDGYPWEWPQAEADKPVVWIITQQGGYKQWEDQYGEGLAVCVDE